MAPAIDRIIRRTGRPSRAVTADRGYGLASVDRDLHPLGVRSVAIPRHGVFAHNLVKISTLAG